jgi:hypothetical protein
VVHSIGFRFFRVGELVNPDRLRHVVPPASGSTVAHVRTRKQLPGGPDVLRWKPRLDMGLDANFRLVDDTLGTAW